MKEIINERAAAAIRVFHSFVSRRLPDDGDFGEVSEAERKFTQVVERVNDRIARRQ